MTMICEKTEKEVIQIADNLLKQGKIKSYTNPEKILISLGRGKNSKPIYKYQSIVVVSNK